jgi:hypothetical protein
VIPGLDLFFKQRSSYLDPRSDLFRSLIESSDVIRPGETLSNRIAWINDLGTVYVGLEGDLESGIGEVLLRGRQLG